MTVIEEKTNGAEPTAPRRITPERFEEAVPSVGAIARVRSTARQQAKEIGVSALRTIPTARPLVDRPRTQPLRSSAIQLYRWWKAPYGTSEKPASLEAIPWDYVKANSDKVPFLGLREYWYPAVTSKEIPHNQPTPVTLLGDNLVFFRDGDGKVRALENRCPHRSVLLSLGQVGVFEPGTLTCRYHGMTFDGDGECIAYLAEGPDSNACGKIRARSYPTTEHGGVVFVYMGEREPPSFLDSQPHAREVLGEGHLFVHRIRLPYSHLNMLDNTVDLSHVGCLHRTCMLFGGQKPFAADIGYDEIDDGRGLFAYFKDPGEHPGMMHINEVEWYLPNLIYHSPGNAGPFGGGGFFWFVPIDEGNFTGWFLANHGETPGNAPQRATREFAARLFMGKFFGRDIFFPGSAMSCLEGGDAAMQNSQGRIVRWDEERLTSTDRAVVKARRMLQAAHRTEVAERAQRAAENKAATRRRVSGQGDSETDIDIVKVHVKDRS